MSNDVTGADFSFDKIGEFDEHINLSIPNYQHIWDTVKRMSSYFIQDRTCVYDLGCSTGIGLNLIRNSNKGEENVSYIGYDISKNMLEKVENRDIVKFNGDITNPAILFPNASIVMSIFTLQFLTPAQRESVLKRVHSGLNKGGAFILCEKVYLNEGKFQDIFTFTYYDFKMQSFTSDDILGKQYALRKIMKPLSMTENEEMLRSAGFEKVQTFFQSLNFVGWVCIK